MRIRKRRPVLPVRNKLTEARENKVLAAIESEGKTIREISIQINVAEARVRYALKVLHRAERVHVQEWIAFISPDGKNRTTPLFRAGKGWDDAPPSHMKCKGMGLRIRPAPNIVQSIFFLWITGDSND